MTQVYVGTTSPKVTIYETPLRSLDVNLMNGVHLDFRPNPHSVGILFGEISTSIEQFPCSDLTTTARGFSVNRERRKQIVRSWVPPGNDTGPTSLS